MVVYMVVFIWLSCLFRTVAVVTNGTAVLGLGNIGPEAGLPVMEGKCVLFKEFGGVDAFPICLNASTREEVIAAVKAIAPTFGGINLEDIRSPECLDIEAELARDLDLRSERPRRCRYGYHQDAAGCRCQKHCCCG